MTKIQHIDDVEELIVKWPRLVKLAQDDSAITSEQLLQLYLTCLQYGAVFFVYNDSGLAGSCCVELVNDYLSLRSLPKGHSLSKSCIAAVVTWARELGVNDVRVTTTKLCGSSYRYFERLLGFRRHSVTFKLDL